MKKHGVIVEYSSDYGANVVIADKPGGKIRLCANFAPFNAVTKKDRYPLPIINEIMRQLGGMVYYSTIDAAKGYWQVPIKKEHQHYTAIIVEGVQYMFLVMPFGLCNAPAVFQRYMNQTFRKQLGAICL